jgi:two-component system, probable response regulator PhcQ
MQQRYDYSKYAILYVDDEEKSLKYFRDIFSSKFQVLTAESAEKGFDLLERYKGRVGIVMSDQRMPGEKGVPFLSRIREFNPKILRILVTAYSDLETAIEAVNTGAVYKYITKPWDIPLLDATLLRGLEFFIVQSERDRLLEEKLSALHRMMITDRVVSLGVLAAGLSHQLRNAMEAVQTFLEIAPPHLDEAPLADLAQIQYPEAWRRYYDRVQSQMDRIERILVDLGESAIPPIAQFRDQVQPHAALAKAENRFKARLEERGIHVVNKIPKNLPSIRADASLFDRMLESLLEETLAGMPVGGTLTMDGMKETDQIIRLQASIHPGGIQTESLRWIFDPLEDLKPDGPRSGLYLLAAFLVAYHHGGVVQCVPEGGKGCVLRFLFPLNPDQLIMKDGSRALLSRMFFSENLWDKFLGPSP